MPKETFPGICALCKAEFSKKDMKKHLKSHLQKNTKESKSLDQDIPFYTQYLILAEGVGISGDTYWMFLKVLGGQNLGSLDRILRKTWVECCDHLSAFHHGRSSIGKSRMVWEFFSPGVKILYEYDFGDTSEVLLTYAGQFAGPAQKGKVEILARNIAPTFKCNTCGQPAVLICPQCAYDDAGFMCENCIDPHDCGLSEETFLPVVNSPRMGICGYEG